MNEEYLNQVYATWSLVTHPIRPNEAELSEMQRRMAAFDRPRTMILGLTPELVDMAVRAGVERPVVYEVRGDVVEALKRMATEDWSNVEFLIDDWRNFRPELEAKFDVLIGHGTLLFIPYPDKWRAVLHYFHRYLVKGGVFISRNINRPEGGYPLEANYERILRRFDKESESTADEERRRLFREAMSEVRQSITLSAGRDDGCIDQEACGVAAGWTREDLKRRYGGSPVENLVEAFFQAPAIKGYGALRPVAAPLWKNARRLMEGFGFSVDETFIGDRPQAGVLCVFTAEKQEMGQP
jgi:hypothetical protein